MRLSDQRTGKISGRGRSADKEPATLLCGHAPRRLQGAGYNPEMENAGTPPSLPLPGSRAPQHSSLNQCVISFGSNLGDRRELVAAAAKRVAGYTKIDGVSGLRTSRLFETPPIGGPGEQDTFLNAIGVFETQASARDVLGMLQELEADLGRQRRRRWDARSIDLDVVLHGNLVGGATGLVVPHPRYTARRFVLVPACDVAAHFRDPRFGWTLGDLAAHLDADVPSLALVTGRMELRETLCRRLADEYGVIVRDAWEACSGADSPDGALGWVTAQMPVLPDPTASPTFTPEAYSGFPRLLVRIHRNSSLPAAGVPASVRGQTQWPAPHQMWPGGWKWPEYRLEIDDVDWAVSELASAFDSMRCAVQPVTSDGHWW